MSSFVETLTRTVNPATQPVGVTFVPDLAALASAKIRLRDRRLTICQQVAVSRYYGWSTLTTSASAHCALGAAAVGLVQLPARVRDGSVNTGVYQKDQPAAARMQAALPRLATPQQGCLTFPLSRPSTPARPTWWSSTSTPLRPCASCRPSCGTTAASS